MARNRKSSGFTAIRIEGGILPPEFLSVVAALEAKHQTGADYGLTKSLTLKDELARYWRIANDLYTAYAERRERTDISPIKVEVGDWLVALLKEVLGFSDLAPCRSVAAGDRAFPITHEACDGAVPVLLTTRDHDLDRADPRFGDEGRRRAPHGLMQELLNASDEALWGIVANGTKLRLLRDNPSLTRPAYIEADLDLIFTEQLYADFAALWLLGHATRLRPIDGKPSGAILERWRSEAHQTGERALEHLRDGVTEALRQLGNGFLQHPENETLRAALSKGEITAERYFQELLRLVYRLLFLFTAEERGLLHSPEATDEQRAIYAEGYSVARLRERALKRRHYDRHDDLWQGLRIIFRSLARGAPALGLPALGGLFDRSQCPHLDNVRISNTDLLAAVRALTYFATGSGLARVNFRDMGTEELGSVYESLLELHPRIDPQATPWTFSFVGGSGDAEARGSERKLSGSYYTPEPLVQELIRSALVPVIERTINANRSDPRKALLDLRIIDPACGSGHFLLAAARRIAYEVARLEAGSDTPDEAARQHALREVVQHCIYGVDRNPMAVELCRTALWIETIEPGKPLSFLDAHIRCGDSLVGVIDLEVLCQGIPDAAYKPLEGDDREVANHYKAKNRRERAERGRIKSGFRLDRQRDLAAALAELADMPEETVDQITAKRARFEELTRQGAAAWTLERACDLWTSAFFARKTRGGQFAGPDGLPRRGAETVATSGTVWELLRGREPFGPLTGAATALAERQRFFHWPLAFADVMARGGFDVVLGNPPWEVMQLSEEEYFAARKSEIAVLAGAARKRAIAALAQADPAAFAEFKQEKRRFEATNVFFRESGRFDLAARGKVNTYALFAELFANLARRRAGVIVPTGIATDATTAPFFAHLVENRRLARLVDFENSAPLFPGVHRSFKFALLTLGRDESAARFAFFLTQPAQLAEPERSFTLSPDQIAAINPNTRTAPVFRSRADADLTAKIYRAAPVLIDEAKGPAGNPWGAEFRQGLFNMTSDSHLFRTAAQLAAAGFRRDGTDWVSATERFVPLYEAKMIHQFDHRWAGYADDGADSADIGPADKANPTFEPSPRYWVPQAEVTARLAAKGWTRGWLMGWRDIARVTDERTVIATVFPKVGCGHTLLLEFPDVQDARLYGALTANQCSLIFDYSSRQKIGGTHLEYKVFKQLPNLPPTFYTEPRLAFLIPRVLELTYTSHSLAPFARDLDHDGPPFAWDEDRRAYLRAELDAFYARAYSLTRDELRYILDPAEVKGAGYPSETFRVLKEKEIRRYGEYRTRRLVLEAWDRMEASGAFAAMGMG